MKNYLFQMIASLNHLINTAIRGFSDWLIYFNSETGCMILKLVDAERMKHTMSVIEQQEEISELGVLNQMTKVVEDAISKGGWDEENETHLNVIANILYNEHDWEEERIQEYVGSMIDHADVKMQSDED